MRLDTLLVKRGLAQSRERAQALIRAGQVCLDGSVISKPGLQASDDARINLLQEDSPWVSRGALKLLHALSYFEFRPEGLCCLDVGVSTGGFTEVLLAQGARHVYGVEVGHGQLAERLRGELRLTLYEGMNVRHITKAEVPEPPQLIVIDVSFISLTLALPAPLALASSGASLIALIKPQFEVGRQQIGKQGVVRSSAARERICQDIAAWLAKTGWVPKGITPSPILGGGGNQEYLIAAIRQTESC